MQVINKKILSFDYKDYVVDIKTADAQKSYKEGVTVLVTGCLTGKDNLKRKFAQSFFLAPQDNGYYVLNDVFRYVEEVEQLESGTVNGVDAAAPPSTLLDIRTWQNQIMFLILLHQTQQLPMRMQIKLLLRRPMMHQSMREN